LERHIDEVEEASSHTPFVPSLDRAWLSEEELPLAAVRHDHQDHALGPPSPPIRSSSPHTPPGFSVPPEPPPPSSGRSPPEGVGVPAASSSEPSEGDAKGNISPEGDTFPEGELSPEGDTFPGGELTSPEGEPTLTSKYWDEKLPTKRRRRPNPKYAHLGNSRIRLQDFIESELLGLDWTKNALQEAPTYYSKMMALLQLATDPFSSEIDGDLHPCLLSTKASQADNPSFDEAMNGPHRDGFYQAMVKELKTLTDMESILQQQQSH
jgi:hypothetical protein